MNKRQLGPLERIFPMPCVIIASGTPDDPAVFTASWINVVASTPPTIAIGIRNIRHTYETIERTGAFSVNIPSSEMADIADYFGLVSQFAAPENKLATVGLTASAGTVAATPIINECAYNLECIVTHSHSVGHYQVILAEIVETHADESILIDPESNVVSMDALDPLIYIAGSREYRRLGPRVADAYSVGRRFIDRKSPAQPAKETE